MHRSSKRSMKFPLKQETSYNSRQLIAGLAGVVKRIAIVMISRKITSALTIALLAISALLSITAVALTEKQQAEMTERIAPVGEVCMQGDANCATAVVASSGPKSGEDVYNTACMACHSTGAGGAPIVGDNTAWGDRIGKGMDVLYVSGVEGLAGTGMIAKGGCMSCSDDEVKAAVDYMVANSQ